MNRFKALAIVTDPKKKGTSEDLEARQVLFNLRRARFKEAIEEHLEAFCLLLSKEEEEDLRSILAILRKYTQ